MTDYTVNDVYAGLNQFKDQVNATLPFKLTCYKGIIDPSVDGQPANIPSLYMQVDALGPNEVLVETFIKVGPADIDWLIFGQGGGPTPMAGIWFLGTGVPSNGLGSDTDWYFDETPTSRAVYYKAAGTWSRKLLGTDWYTGAVVPNVSLGVDGNMYLRTDTSQIYLKAGGTWTAIMSPTIWLRGTGAPSNLLGADDQYYEDTASGEVYFKAAGTWNLTLIHGTQWIRAAGVPNNAAGLIGYYYEDTNNGDVYYKTGVATWALTSIGGGAPTWTYVNAAFNIVSGGKYLVDTSGGPVPGTLPVQANMASTFNAEFKDAAGTWATNNFTIVRAVAATYTLVNSVTDLTVNQNSYPLSLAYDSTTDNVAI